MTVFHLAAREVRKPWGRRDLPPPFPLVPAAEEPLGEIWFEDSAAPDRELLVKLLFTGEKLSVQVHPDKDAARSAGFASGKDEVWIIVDAEPGAVIGLGPLKRLTRTSLEAAALDGSIETLIEWRPVKRGEVIYSPAGTIHALGAGLTIIEVQQNVDVTYRLFDYGRNRELHVPQAVAASALEPYQPQGPAIAISEGRRVLASGAFTVEALSGPSELRLDCPPGEPVWLIPQSGAVTVEGKRIGLGSVSLVEGGCELTIDPASELVAAYAGEWHERLVR